MSVMTNSGKLFADELNEWLIEEGFMQSQFEMSMTCSSPRRTVRSHSLVCSENPFSIVEIGPIPVKEL